MLRFCLIGSLVFHMVILWGVGFCLPRYTASGSAELYFEVDTLAAFATATEIETDSSEDEVERETNKPENRNPALIFPANVENQKEVVLADHSSEKVAEFVSELSSITAPAESLESSKNSPNPAGSLSGGSRPDSEGRVGIKKVPNAKAEGNSIDSSLGAKSGWPVPDLPPLKIYFPSPEYPWKAKRNNWEGVVHLRAEILPNGKIGEILIVNSSGYKILDMAARKTIRTWRFKPALKNGAPVICYKNIPVRFQMEE